jgi:hypothetical protein
MTCGHHHKDRQVCSAILARLQNAQVLLMGLLYTIQQEHMSLHHHFAKLRRGTGTAAASCCHTGVTASIRKLGTDTSSRYSLDNLPKP